MLPAASITDRRASAMHIAGNRGPARHPQPCDRNAQPHKANALNRVRRDSGLAQRVAILETCEHVRSRATFAVRFEAPHSRT